MKHFTAMRNPYEAVIWIAGMIVGGITYLKTSLDLLDSTFITWEKVVGLAWGMLAALLTGMFAVFGKRLATIVVAYVSTRFFKKKKP